MQKFFEVFWSHRWFGLLGAAGLATIAGLASAWLTPRGPVTTAQALLSIVVALLVGMAAGFIMGSRWSMFIVPGVFISLAIFGFNLLGDGLRDSLDPRQARRVQR